VNIVQGKTYSTETEIGRLYWQRVEMLLSKYSLIGSTTEIQEQAPAYRQYLSKVRIGQGAFRVLVNDAYDVEISKKIREEFENGRDYYKYHGQKLLSLPRDPFDLPNREFLRWHNENIFRI